MDQIEVPRDGSGFQYWGSQGRLLLPPGLPDVELRYRTEPPHGDFLYSLGIRGRPLASPGIRLFWGRNLVLSPCATFLGAVEYTRLTGDICCVINLDTLNEWKHRGHVRLCSLVFPTLKVQCCEEEKVVDLSRRRWKPLAFFDGPDPGDLPW